MAEIFVSYSRSDSEFVDKLIGELDSKGMKVWIDRDDIEGGERWRAAIVQAISQCRAFLLILSPNSANSRNVSTELTLAENKQRRIIPIIYQTCDIPDGMEYQLAELQRIDFTQSYEEALKRLIRVLTRATEQIARQQLQPTVPDKAAPESIPVDNESTQNANTVNSSESQRAAERAEAPRKISPKPERPSPVITNVSSEIIITERRVAQVNTSSWLPETLVVSRDSRRVAWVTTVSGFLGIVSKCSVIVDGVERKPYANVTKTIIFSPDSQRVAYGAQVGEKWIAVVDGEEGKVCSGISDGTPIFSPDSQRVAYEAHAGDKWIVVVDGVEGKGYDGFLRGSQITFDSSERFHSLAINGNDILLLTARIK